jgi:N6-adenosine-specific RNA methylase IME4
MTGVALAHYDAARTALAQAVRIDEVKQIRDLAVAAQVYAQQAQDVEMINNATELRERAERRAGEVLQEMKEQGARQKAGDNPQGRGNGNNALPLAPKLADLGITPMQSSRWQTKARMPADKFEEHLTKAKRRAVTAGRDTAAAKQQRRADREVELAAATIEVSEALGSKLYGVIYADPPWRFEPYNRDTGMDRAADNHYPTMTLDGIKALPVPAAPDCVLFLWATVPMLPQAVEVMAAWGFTYKSNFAWVKDRAGTGYWNRNRHELLLIGTRGNIPAPAPGEQYESAIAASVGEHSAKPFHFREIIEDMFPTLPRVELFHRGESFAGWDVWGNEVSQAA